MNLLKDVNPEPVLALNLFTALSALCVSAVFLVSRCLLHASEVNGMAWCLVNYSEPGSRGWSCCSSLDPALWLDPPRDEQKPAWPSSVPYSEAHTLWDSQWHGNTTTEYTWGGSAPTAHLKSKPASRSVSSKGFKMLYFHTAYAQGKLVWSGLSKWTELPFNGIHYLLFVATSCRLITY